MRTRVRRRPSRSSVWLALLLTSACATPARADDGTTLAGMRQPMAADAASDGGAVVVGTSFADPTQDFIVVRVGADGTLVRAFGDQGIARIDFAGGPDQANAVRALADGAVIVAGSGALSDRERIAIARLDSAGRLDPAFGDGGRVTPDLGPGDANATALAVDAQGRIVVVGQADDSFVALRLRVDGRPDPAFGDQGVVRVHFATGPSAAYALALQPDGGIVVAGTSGAAPRSGYALARLRADGTLDTSFGAGGRVEGAFADAMASVMDLVLQPTGHVVLVATSMSRTSTLLALVGFTPDGAVDAAFGQAGTAVHELCDRPLRVLAVGPGAGGGFMLLEACVGITMLAQFTATGALDPSFAEAGRRPIGPADGPIVTSAARLSDERLAIVGMKGAGRSALWRVADNGVLDPYPAPVAHDPQQPEHETADEARTLALQADGKLVAAGLAILPGFRFAIAIARYEPDGALDPTFGDGGRVLMPLPGHEQGEALAIAPQADGALVMVAERRPSYLMSTDVMLARFRADGSLDPGFGVDGTTVTDFGGTWQSTRDLLPLAHGGFLVGGRAQADRGLAFALARFDARGVVDPSFGHAGIVTTPLDETHLFMDPPSLAAAPHGGVVAAATVRGTLTLARWNADGTVDARFGTDGIARLDTAIASIERVRLRVDPDGGLLVGGTVDAGGRRRLAVLRFDAAGRLDRAFGEAGIADTHLDIALHHDLLRLPDGRIVVAGATRGGSGSAFGLARLQRDGSLDATFGTRGVLATAFAGDDAAAALVRQGARLVVLGTARTKTQADFALARYGADGTLDPTFGNGGRVTTDLGGFAGLRALVAAHPAMPPEPGDEPSCDAGGMPRISGTIALGSDRVPAGDSSLQSLGFFTLDGPPPSPLASPHPLLEVRLSGATTRAPGAPLELAVALVNRTDGPLVVLEPDDPRRAPAFVLFLRDEHDGRMYEFDDRRGSCGNVNPIQRESYRTLAAGEVRALSHPIPLATAEAPLIAGQYTLWAAYVFCGPDPNGYVPLGEDYIRSDALRGIFVSNAVAITVAVPGP